MEQLKQMGGKRRGAGRKPIMDKKKQYSFYIAWAEVVKFGGEEKFKKSVSDFIYGSGKEEVLNSQINYAPVTTTAFDGKKMNMGIIDEAPMFQEVKSPVTGLPPKLSDFDKFEMELKGAKSRAEVEAIMKRSVGGIMFPKERFALKSVADSVLEDMFND